MPNVLRYRASQSPSPASGGHPRRVTGSYLQPLLEAAAAHGLTPAGLARGAGLAPEALSDASLADGLPADAYVDLLDAGADLAGDAFFGLHVGERVKMGTYSVYGLMLLSCENYGQAFEQTMRYEELAHDLGKSSIGVDGFMARYAWRSFYAPRHRHLVDSVFAGIRVFSNWLAGTTLPPALITLTHDGAGDEAGNAEYERIFGAMPTFGARENSASFPAQMLEWPVPNADVALYPLLQRHAELLLRQRSQVATAGDVVRQVEAVVIRNLAQDRARLASVAQDLNLAPRTLQRKLGEAGTSFQQVLDGARHALARDYLRQPDLSLSDIAFLLGYREQSAFTHAFREWSGTSPGAWRQKG